MFFVTVRGFELFYIKAGLEQVTRSLFVGPILFEAKKLKASFISNLEDHVAPTAVKKINRRAISRDATDRKNGLCKETRVQRGLPGQPVVRIAIIGV